jgi:hypothetical protein
MLEFNPAFYSGMGGFSTTGSQLVDVSGNGGYFALAEQAVFVLALAVVAWVALTWKRTSLHLPRQGCLSVVWATSARVRLPDAASSESLTQA